MSSARASEAVLAFFSQLDRAGHGDVSIETVRPLFLDSCSSCSTGYQTVRRLRANGQHIEGNEHVVKVDGVHQERLPNTFTVTASIRTTSGRLVASDGHVIRQAAASPTYHWIFSVTGAPSLKLSTSTIVPS